MSKKKTKGKKKENGSKSSTEPDEGDSKDESSPFKLTKNDLESIGPDLRKPKKKIGIVPQLCAETWKMPTTLEEQTRLFEVHTVSSKLKRRHSENINRIWDDLEAHDDSLGSSSISDEETSRTRGKSSDSSATCKDRSSDFPPKGSSANESKDPIYEMACIRRYITGSKSLSKCRDDLREMFLLRHSSAVKRAEQKRLQAEIEMERKTLQKKESELRLGEQAFDQFLQENDRKAIKAMKRAEEKTLLRQEKAVVLKELDNRIISLKREINKLKDILSEYDTYQGFLSSLSPEADKVKMQDKQVRTPSPSTSGDRKAAATTALKSRLLAKALTLKSGKGALISAQKDLLMQKQKAAQEASAKAAADEVIFDKKILGHLDMSPQEVAKARDEVKLPFQEPEQLLTILTDLEDENLSLIQECREAEGDLDRVLTAASQTRESLNHQASSFEAEVKRLENKIQEEIKCGRELRKTQLSQRASEEESAAAEDKVLHELDLLVRSVYFDCTREDPARELTTMALLKRVELKMESLTQELEGLPEDMVKIAQMTCEKERRRREMEARLKRQKQLEADRNKRALDRALAPPYIRPELRKEVKVINIRRRKYKREEKMDMFYGKRIDHLTESQDEG